MKSLLEVAKLVGLKRRQIQEYEVAGVAIKPVNTNKYGHLLYDIPEIERLWQLKFYKELGYKIPDIKKIQEVGISGERDKLEGVIGELKKKRDTLDNLISIAEMMNKTGLRFNDIKNEVVETDDLSANETLDIIGACSDVVNQSINDEFDEVVISDKQWEEIYACIDNICEYMKKNLNIQDELIQLQMDHIQKVFVDVFSESVYLLKMFLLPLVNDYGLSSKETEYFINALQFYCDKHKKNPTDMLYEAAIDNIIELGFSKHTTGCKEVQEEVKKIHVFFERIRIFSSEDSLTCVKKMGEFYNSQKLKKMIDNENSKGLSWFISRAIEIYVNNYEMSMNNIGGQ